MGAMRLSVLSLVMVVLSAGTAGAGGKIPWDKIPGIRISEFKAEFISRVEKKLEEIKNGSRSFPAEKGVTELQIGDYLVDVEPSSELDYEDALILAMKREEAAFILYTYLSRLAGDEELKRIFLALAQEEAKHPPSWARARPPRARAKGSAPRADCGCRGSGRAGSSRPSLWPSWPWPRM